MCGVLSKFNPEYSILVCYFDSAENIGIALKSGGGSYLSLAFLAVVGSTVNKRGMFKAPSSAKTSVSFTDAAQGTAFWYCVLNFLIWGVEEESFVIPGLETEELSISGESNCSKAKAVAAQMLAKCEGAYKHDPSVVLPEDHF